MVSVGGVRSLSFHFIHAYIVMKCKERNESFTNLHQPLGFLDS